MWSELQNMTSWMKSWDWKLLLALVPCTNRVFKVSKILWNVDPDVHPETLVWSDEFDTLDESKWTHLVTTHPLVRLWRIVSSTPHISIQFRMIFNITAITGPTAGSVRARCTWCRPSPPQNTARTFFTAAALTSTRRWVNWVSLALVTCQNYCSVPFQDIHKIFWRTQSILATFGMTRIISAATAQDKILSSQFSSPGSTLKLVGM